MMRSKRMLLLALGMSLLLVTAVSAFGIANDVSRSDPFDVEQIIAALAEKIPKEDFGGVYLDDGGQLVVNLKEGPDFDFNSPLSNRAAVMIKVETVPYAPAELEEMKAFFEPYMADYNIAALDANEVTNTVDIE